MSSKIFLNNNKTVRLLLLLFFCVCVIFE